jgi:hypothetical protein
MADDIKGVSASCAADKHALCATKVGQARRCYCECHKPRSERSIAWQARELAGNAYPDDQRLQVLIHLVAELAERMSE